MISLPATYLQYLFQNKYEGIVQFSLEGQIVFSNPTAATVLGFGSVDSLIDDAGPFLQYLKHNAPARFGRMIAELRVTGQPMEVEFDFVRQIDDTPSLAAGAFRRLEAIGDQEACYVVSLIDRSQKYEIERLQAELERERRANVAKTEFLTSMSHETRTPLSSVFGSLELLAGTQLAPQQLRYLQYAQISANTLLEVLNDIQDVAKIQAGELLTESAPYSIRAVTEELVQHFAPKAVIKQLELRVHIHSSVPENMVGDRGRVKQVIYNLLENAVKFTAEGSICLTVACKRDEVGLAKLVVCVEDTGCGIPSVQKEYLLNLFTEAHYAATPRHGGVRLGLTLSHQLLRLMGGHIVVASESGKGSAFTVNITLPIATQSQQDPDSASVLPAYPDASEACSVVVYTTSVKAASAQQTGLVYRTVSDTELQRELAQSGDDLDSDAKNYREHLDSPTILLVEDNALNQIVAEETLLDAGYRVLLAANGEEALSLIEQGGVDLVLMDCQMPVLDGFATTRSIRTTERDNGILVSKQLPIVALTANTVKGDREKAFAAGMNEYVTKPFQADMLFAVLDQYIFRPVNRQDDAGANQATGTG